MTTKSHDGNVPLARPTHREASKDLPRDARTRAPLPKRAQPGYYPKFSTLSQQAFWDDATRTLVLGRVEKVPPIRFFTKEELPLVSAIYDRIIPQTDRDDAHRIPVVSYIDERLFLRRSDGYRFEGMPHDDEAHQLGLQAIESIAQKLYARSFVALTPVEQDQILESIRNGDPAAGQEIWARMPIGHYWTLLVQDGVEAYYAHPFAWDEIGFGGPAYPRGYMRLENGVAEPWEVDEQRYGWLAPEGHVSDSYRPLGGATDEQAGGGHPGQGGSH